MRSTFFQGNSEKVKLINLHSEATGNYRSHFPLYIGMRSTSHQRALDKQNEKLRASAFCAVPVQTDATKESAHAV